MKRKIFFVYLVILTILFIAISIYAITFIIFEAIKHSENIIVWLEEYVSGPRGSTITRFLLYIFYAIGIFGINSFLIYYCIEEYKKM